ncbi:hypothetical protein Syun_020613 [Stephania yunnanensis]|uniref:Uncharacterized protein n=1 Tax=Stephania yunnanensis TaxID=152371 RepID=A0AAP0NRL1_9MAGN
MSSMYRNVPSKNLRSSVTLYFAYGGRTGRRGDAGDRNVHVHESLMTEIADLKNIVNAKLGIQAYELIKFMYKEEEMMDNRVLGDHPVTDNTYVEAMGKKKHVVRYNAMAERIAAAKAVIASTTAASTTIGDTGLSQPQPTGDVESEPENPERIRMTASYHRKLPVQKKNKKQRKHLKRNDDGRAGTKRSRFPSCKSAHNSNVNWDNTSRGSLLVSEISFYNKTMRYLDIIEPHNLDRVMRQLGYVQGILKDPFQPIDADMSKLATLYYVKYTWDP